MKKNYCLLALLAFPALGDVFAQCTAGNTPVAVNIVPDNYGSEITWNIKEFDGSPTYGSGGPYTDNNTTPVYDTVCVPTGSSVTFTINDGYGDGICCGEGIGSYTVTVGGYTVATGGQYTFTESTTFVAPPYSIDAGITSCSLNSYVNVGSNTITGVFKNYGLTNITSIEIGYSINNGAPVTFTKSSINVTAFGTYSFTHPTAWVCNIPATYSIKIWTGNINGNTDLNHPNDTLVKNCNVAYRSIQRLPLIEEFTSSTCSPCAAYNADFDPILVANDVNTLAGTASVVKYQMNWPSPGNDPSYNSHGNTRKTFYSVSGIPDMFIDGVDYPEIASQAQSDIDERRNEPSYMDLVANHTITGNTVDVITRVIPFVNVPATNLKLFTAVVEDYYYYPASTTTQDDFHQVMRKMVPSASGVNAGALTAYNIKTFTQSTALTTVSAPPPAQGSYDLWVGMSNIHVVTWIQHSTTHEVFQSAISEICSPIPVTTAVTDENCNQKGSMELSVTGGASPYTYYWDGLNDKSTSIATGLGTGIYPALIVDKNRCMALVTDTINGVPGVSGAVTSVNASCGLADGSATISSSGGTPPYTYSWSNGGTESGATGLAAATYTVTITDASGCSFAGSAAISNTEGPYLDAAVYDATQGNTNGLVDLIVSGGTTPYTYSWNNGALSEDVENVAGGDYTVTVTDAAGCISIATYTVNDIVGISEIKVEALNMLVSPNPSSGIFTLYFNLKQSVPVHLNIKNVLGQSVLSRETGILNSGNNFIGINSSRFKPGVYFVELTAGEMRVAKEVLITKQ